MPSEPDDSQCPVFQMTDEGAVEGSLGSDGGEGSPPPSPNSEAGKRKAEVVSAFVSGYCRNW